MPKEEEFSAFLRLFLLRVTQGTELCHDPLAWSHCCRHHNPWHSPSPSSGSQEAQQSRENSAAHFFSLSLLVAHLQRAGRMW